jgi:arabinan endo-1,5-alpha-L-arabinosidase
MDALWERLRHRARLGPGRGAGRLDAETGKLSSADTTLHALASRRPLPPPAIEAPFLVRKGPYHYLFVSFDRCCRGKDSTYKVVVGRAESITGPYRDRNGTPMMEGGGSYCSRAPARGEGLAIRPCASTGTPTSSSSTPTTRPPAGRGLHISTMVWVDGWPRVGRLN